MADTLTKAKDKMTLTPAGRVIMHQLVYRGIQTEHELVQSIVNKTGLTEGSVTPEIGNMLCFLRRHGFVWAGIVTNRENKGMWVAVVTAEGRKFTKDNAI